MVFPFSKWLGLIRPLVAGFNRPLTGFEADELQPRNMLFWEEFVQAVSTDRSFS